MSAPWIGPRRLAGKAARVTVAALVMALPLLPSQPRASGAAFEDFFRICNDRVPAALDRANQFAMAGWRIREDSLTRDQAVRVSAITAVTDPRVEAAPSRLREIFQDDLGRMLAAKPNDALNYGRYHREHPDGAIVIITQTWDGQTGTTRCVIASQAFAGVGALIRDFSRHNAPELRPLAAIVEATSQGGVGGGLYRQTTVLAVEPKYDVLRGELEDLQGPLYGLITTTRLERRGQ